MSHIAHFSVMLCSLPICHVLKYGYRLNDVILVVKIAIKERISKSLSVLNKFSLLDQIVKRQALQVFLKIFLLQSVFSKISLYNFVSLSIWLFNMKNDFL